MFQSIGGIAQVTIRLVGSMILARLLTPDDFGVFALVVLVYGLFAQLKTFGAVQAIISKKNITQKQLSTSFYINFSINIILFILLWFMAGFIADLYNEERLIDPMRVMSIVFIFHAFSTIPSALLERNMYFHYVNIIGIIGAIIEMAISIILVYYLSYNYWAMVWALIISEFWMTIIKIILSNWKPTLEFSRVSFLFFIRYGSYLAGETAFIYIRQNLDYFIVGKMIGTASLGIYSFAYRLPNIVYTRLLGPISGIINPSMTMLKTQNEITNAFLKFTKYNGYIAAPILILMFVLAKPIILLLWGNQWIDAIELMKILVLVAGIQAIALPIGSVFLRLNNPKSLFKISIIKVFFSLLTVLLFGYAFGLTGIAYGMTISAILSYFVSFYYLKKIIDISFRNIFETLMPLVIISAIAFSVTYIINSSFYIENHVLNILITSLICFTSYIASIKLFNNEWNEIKNIIRLLKEKRKQ